MRRSCAYQVPVDSGFFTPLGLQPAAVCRLAFEGAGRWLGRHAISHRRLVAEHRTGFVFWSVQLVPGDPIGFFDADRLDVTVTGRVRGGGTQVECEVVVEGMRPEDDLPPLRKAVECDAQVEGGWPEDDLPPLTPRRKPGGRGGCPTLLKAVCVPLQLDGGPALSGAPARLSPEVLSAFRHDEVEARPHRSPLPGLGGDIPTHGGVSGRGAAAFVIHRHQCEVADQWFWPEAVSMAGGAREDLVLANAGFHLAMQAPVRRLDLLFSRPFYLFDEGAVRSTAHEWEGGVAFVHEFVCGDEPRPRAVAIEQFAWD
jgi:hypothetical protein